VAFTLSACAPASFRLVASDAAHALRIPRDVTTLADLDRTAWSAWLRMELARLEQGTYDTRALLDLDLPQGTRWTLVSLAPDSFMLRVENDLNEARLVSQDGVADASAGATGLQ